MREGRGSALVEFALIAPLLLLLLLGIMVVGIAINAKIVVTGAAREGARTWAIEQGDDAARARAAEAIRAGGLPWHSGPTTLFDPASDVAFDRQGAYIAVTVTYRQPTFVPLLGRILDPQSPGDGTLTLRSRALFRVER
jgi:hypothetical protein